MKIQISPVKKVEDALVVWHKPGEEVDLCIDPRDYKGLPFKEGSLDVIYSFGILGITSPGKVVDLMNSMRKCLKVNKQLYIIENDFEYINRAVIGGDLSIREFNKTFIKQSYFDQNLLVELLEESGFPKKDQRIWKKEGIRFNKEHFELIISGTKPKK